MKTKRGRYHSEAAILKLIDGCHARIAKYLGEAENHDEIARRLTKLLRSCKDTEEHGGYLRDIEYHRAIAAKLRKTVLGNEKRAIMLGKRLAEFRTATFSFMGSDLSIPR